MQWREANGMSWPPAASHATEPEHYTDNCAECRTIEWVSHQEGEPLPSVSYAPFRMTPLSDRERPTYRCTYQCKRGHVWQCWTSLGTWVYSDCRCGFCVRSRMEMAA
jgi:hypothetical protein